MPRTGTMDLPLHGGAAPQWLVQRMVRLARAICEAMISEYDEMELLKRLSDPDWFQALSCVLAFDWHSSGTTTVLCGVLKTVLDPEEHGVAVVGGKGSRSRMAPAEIDQLAPRLSLGTSGAEDLKRASRLSAKVDSALIQDGYNLYHHCMFISESGEWAVVQQGMDPVSRTARRYHWLSVDLKGFVEEPHSGIACDLRRDSVLNMTSKEARQCRKMSLELAGHSREQLLDDLAMLRAGFQRSLLQWAGGKLPSHRVLPERVDWAVMNRIYDFRPRNYEDLVLVRGVGPMTVRALALISDLIYGKPPSWEDPVKYSYAFGGKDGVPYPVDRHSYDEGIEVLSNAVKDAKLGDWEKMGALRSLRRLTPPGIHEDGGSWLT